MSVLARGQAAAEAGMGDACTVQRSSGSDTTNPVTGVGTTTYTTLYTGKCRVQQNSVTGSRHDIGQDSTLTQPFIVSVPTAVTGLKVGDRVTITSAADADLVGRVFLVGAVVHKANLTARRLGVEEITD